MSASLKECLGQTNGDAQEAIRLFNLNRPIADLHRLDRNTIRALERAGVFDLGTLTTRSEKEWLSSGKRIGKKRLAKLRFELAAYGLKFKGE
jgi:hypothetical protein